MSSERLGVAVSRPSTLLNASPPSPSRPANHNCCHSRAGKPASPRSGRRRAVQERVSAGRRHRAPPAAAMPGMHALPRRRHRDPSQCVQALAIMIRARSPSASSQWTPRSAPLRGAQLAARSARAQAESVHTLTVDRRLILPTLLGPGPGQVTLTVLVALARNTWALRLAAGAE